LFNGQAGNDHRDTQGHEDHYEDYPYLHIFWGFIGSGFRVSLISLSLVTGYPASIYQK
jgi:hypothetical protein